MIKINEYFDGKVKSMAINNNDGRATVGVMLPGQYEFGTSTEEKMEVIEAKCTFPSRTRKKTYSKGQFFIVPAMLNLE
jgi:uncharacterized protein YaiE (UPF0345 family)